MKKSITRILATVAGLGVLGAGGAWFVASNSAINHAEKMIAELNAKSLPQNGTLKITYDSLSRSSCPAVGIRLVNPVISTSVPADAQGHPAMDAQWKRTGSIDIVTDYLKNQFRVVSDGAGQLHIKSGTDDVTTTSDAGHIDVTLAAKNRAAFTQWNTRDVHDKEAVQKAAKDIAALHVNISPLSIKDADSKAVIFTQDASAIHLINQSVEGTIHFDLDLALNGMEITKEYGPFVQRLLHAAQMPEGVWNEEMPFSSTRAGTQDLAINMQVKMPDAPGVVPDGYIHIPTLRIKNNFYSFDMPVDLVMKEENNLRSASLKANATLEVTPAAAQEVQAGLATLTNTQGLGGVLMQLAGATKLDVDKEALKQKITEALPTISTLGPITLAIDFDASVPIPKAGDAPLTKPAAGSAPNERLTIRALNFNHARWGLTTKGVVTRVSGSAPSVDVNILCKHCDAMTKDIYETASAAQAALTLMNPARAQWPLSDTLLASLNSAFANIGKKDEVTGDILFGVTSPTAGDYRINEKPMAEIMPTLMDVFAPLMAAQQSPTAGLPIPPAPAAAH